MEQSAQNKQLEIAKKVEETIAEETAEKFDIKTITEETKKRTFSLINKLSLPLNILAAGAFVFFAIHYAGTSILLAVAFGIFAIINLIQIFLQIHRRWIQKQIIKETASKSLKEQKE